MHRSLLLVAALGCLLQTTDLFAHFLFIRIGQHAEAGRSVDVFFSERAEAGDPKFVSKIAHAKLWMQESPGKFTPLNVRTASDRLRAFLPSQGAVSVGGECEYGVLTRDVPFLLQYFPKAIAGEPAKLNAMQPRPEIPFEIVARVEESAITLIALAQGKPVPGALFTTVDDDLVNEELKADEAGRAVWRPDSAGHYCVYAKHVIRQAGSRGDQQYAEIRQFATLAFEWPFVRTGADAEAVEIFERAIAARAVWKEFPGFSAKVAGVVDGREFDGRVQINAEGNVQLDVGENDAADWVEEQLGSIVLHRRDASTERAKPVLRFADHNNSHPFGRLLTFVGGSFASSYRVKDDQITVVNRNIGPQNFTITVLDNEQNAEAKFLPRTYTVQYWDARTGRLERTETFRNGWVRVGTFDLPSELTVATASESGLTVRTLRLSDHKLLPAKR